MGAGSHRAHSPHVGPSSGQEAWVAAGAGELAGRRRPRPGPGHCRQNSLGQGAFGIATVFLSPS